MAPLKLTIDRLYLRSTGRPAPAFRALGLAMCLLCLQVGATELAPEEFQQQLDRAAELNVTAPWRESQEVLDRLEPYLDQATEGQYATFKHLEARNQVLSGDLEGGLATLEALMERPMSAGHWIRALGLAANTAMLLRRYEAAFKYLEQALEQKRRSDSAQRSGDPFSLAAYIYANIGQIEHAREYGHLAVKYALDAGDQRGLCVSQQRLAFVYKVDNDTDNARRYYRDALDTCRETGDDVLIGVVEYGLADLLRETGEVDAAESLFDQAMPRLQAAGYETGVAEARLYRARLHFARGEIDRAKALLEASRNQLQRNEAWDYLAEAQQMLGRIAWKRSDFDGALGHFEAQMAARERFLNADRARQLAYLEVKFDTQFNEQELALLREQARVRELEAETRQQQERLRYLGYGIAAFLVIVLVLLLVHATRERRHYRSLARRDGLTGLNNHTRFFEIASPAFETSRRNGTPFTLVLADIDHFKQVNDRHGHLTGDEVLRRVGARLREIFGPHGEIGRVGGEEFAIALPGRHREDIGQPLEALRQALRHGRSDDKQIQISVSFGVAELAGDETLNELRERADQALYRAKRAGRDRVVYADDPD